MERMPVIIARFLALPDIEGFDIHNKFAYLIKSIDGDAYYLEEFLPGEKFISKRLGIEVYKEVTKGITYSDIFYWYKVFSMPISYVKQKGE